ncbi:MAG: hypothetical protein LBG29_05250 [Synergistaceae bacterium]|jgi:hypothetical protein|nr:hypothetical protein [Synergistaceae bacterium]
MKENDYCRSSGGKALLIRGMRETDWPGVSEIYRQGIMTGEASGMRLFSSGCRA